MFKKRNYCNREPFNALAMMLKLMYPHNNYEIREIYLDAGQEMWWETIVCDNGNEFGGYQILSPVQWLALNDIKTVDALLDFAKAISDEQDHLMK